jgi:hypothetical protein
VQAGGSFPGAGFENRSSACTSYERHMMLVGCLRCCVMDGLSCWCAVCILFGGTSAAVKAAVVLLHWQLLLPAYEERVSTQHRTVQDSNEPLIHRNVHLWGGITWIVQSLPAAAT